MTGGYDGKGIWFFGLTLLLPFLFFGLGLIETGAFLGAVIFVIYFSILVLNFEAGFLALIFIRSSLDSLKHFSGGGGVIIGAVSVALIVLGVFYTLYKKVNILKFEDSGPFLIFLMFCGVSIVYSPIPKESVSDLLRLLSVFSVYVVTRIIFVTRQKLFRLFAAILISSLLPVLVGCYQLLTGHGTVLDAGQHRIVGTFLHPNPFATYLMLLLVFLSAQILEGKQRISKRFMVLLTAAMFVIFVFTFSRGAWIAFAVSMAVLGVIRYKRLLGLMPAVLVGAFLMIPGIKDRLINIFDAGYTGGRSGWEWRLETWTDISAMVRQSPWIGHGLSSVEAEFGVLTHNDYLRLAAEVGVLGLLSYLFLMGTVMSCTWRDYQTVNSRISKSFQAALIATSVGIFVRQFADNTSRGTVVMMYLWIFIAISRNLAQVYARQPAAPEAQDVKTETLCLAAN